jgi:hypothetical protein
MNDYIFSEKSDVVSIMNSWIIVGNMEDF